MNAIDLAAQQLGLNETTKAAALRDYLTTGGANLDPATTAWCAAFVNSTLAQSGQEGTGSNMARSYLGWGEPVDKPERGDIAVFWRGEKDDGTFGHVGFFEGYNPDGTIRVLGGNQGDSVSVASYPAERLLGFRRGKDVTTDSRYPGTVQGEVAALPRSQNALPAGQAAPQNAMAQYAPAFQYNALQIDPNAFRMT